jgi:hypothetical protein
MYRSCINQYLIYSMFKLCAMLLYDCIHDLSAPIVFEVLSCAKTLWNFTRMENDGTQFTSQVQCSQGGQNQTFHNLMS